jgi:hypothetical protein
MSAIIIEVGQYSNPISPLSIAGLEKWNCMSMCFERLVVQELLAI